MSYGTIAHQSPASAALQCITSRTAPTIRQPRPAHRLAHAPLSPSSPFLRNSVPNCAFPHQGRRAFIGKSDWATRVFRLKERGSCRIGSVRLNWAGELASFQAREQSRLAVRSCTKGKG